jgi:SAM-dependent methyltransferase
MAAIDIRKHWESIYATREETRVSWYQCEPHLSLELIRAVAPVHGGRIIDVGSGASVLVDRLLDLAFEKVAVLDISETALEKAKSRLGARSGKVDWIVADITRVPALGPFDVWHDRAVFHFLTDPTDRRKYVEVARKTVPAGGYLVIATFADDGPPRCSGLDSCRYNARTMSAELEAGFALVREAREIHRTPQGFPQEFFYGVFRRQ